MQTTNMVVSIIRTLTQLPNFNRGVHPDAIIKRIPKLNSGQLAELLADAKAAGLVQFVPGGLYALRH